MEHTFVEQANKGFRASGKTEPSPLYRERPGDDQEYLCFQDGSGFACFVTAVLILDTARWAIDTEGLECIGKLGGRMCRDSEGEYVIIEKAVQNQHAESNHSSVYIDNDAQAIGRTEFEKACRTLDILGWIHTHPPGCGAFFSSTDRVNQKAYTHRNSIGIVIDPLLQEGCIKVFRGPTSIELTPTRTIDWMDIHEKAYQSVSHERTYRDLENDVTSPPSIVVPHDYRVFHEIRFHGFAQALVAICICATIFFWTFLLERNTESSKTSLIQIPPAITKIEIDVLPVKHTEQSIEVAVYEDYVSLPKCELEDNFDLTEGIEQ